MNDDDVRLLGLRRRKLRTTNGLPVRHLGPVAQAGVGISRRLQIFFKPTSEMPYSFASVCTGLDYTFSYSSLRVSVIGCDAIAQGASCLK